MELSNQLITIAQAAEEFGVNPKTLETWRHRGEITRIGTAAKDGVRPGRRAGLYDRAQIEAALACRARASERPSRGAQPNAGNPTPAPLGIPRSSALAERADELAQVAPSSEADAKTQARLSAKALGPKPGPQALRDHETKPFVSSIWNPRAIAGHER
jgi:hypothetical protein